MVGGDEDVAAPGQDGVADLGQAVVDGLDEGADGAGALLELAVAVARVGVALQVVAAVWPVKNVLIPSAARAPLVSSEKLIS